MNAICLLVAGVVRAVLPASEFSLAWDHSVERSRWEERYRVDGDALILYEARVQGTGAGMEPPRSATFADGWWTWRPQTRLSELRLTFSVYAGDYTVCWREACSSLAPLVGPIGDGSVVTIRRCGTR